MKRKKEKQGEHRPPAPLGLLQDVRCALDAAGGVAAAASKLEAAVAAAAHAVGDARKAASDLSQWSNALVGSLWNVASYYDDKPVTSAQAGLTPTKAMCSLVHEETFMRCLVPMQFEYHATRFYVRKCFPFYMTGSRRG